MPAPSPQDFAAMAAQSDAYEIAAAQDALAQSRQPQVRSFAEQMVAEHTRSHQALRQAATASGLEPPALIIGADQARLLMSLQALRGADFDKAYARQQVLAHTSALTVMRSYAAEGDDMNLRRAAQQAVPMIQRHLELATRLAGAPATP